MHHTASTLISSSQDLLANPQCSYCQQSHSSLNCPNVTDIAARKQILKTSGRCFNCLCRNHVSQHCKFSSRCQKCKRMHHTSICEPHAHLTSRYDSQLPSLAHPSGPSLNPENASYQSSTVCTSNNLCSHNTQAVFLQTARAVIQNPQDPHMSLEVRLLLDSGSQKSYLTERARELLHLDAAGEQSLSIATFGSHKGSVKVCPIVNVGICLSSYPRLTLSLYAVPTICEPLLGQPVAACIGKTPASWGWS